MILLIFLAIFLFVLFLNVTSRADGRESMRSSFSHGSPTRVFIHGKTAEMSVENGQYIYRYIIVASKLDRKGKLRKAERFEINMIDQMQMRERTQVTLFFDDDKNYLGFEPALERSQKPLNKAT